MKLSIENVSKTYPGGVWGLREFSLELTPGVVGLLGPNGAGKTTLMNILATITRPTAGSVKWNGTDTARSPDVVRGVLGYLPQDFGVYPHLNCIEFLEYMAAIRGLDGRAARERIHQLIRLANLAEVSRRSLGSFSGGMKQRVGIAQALLNDPQLLIVDEPTAGLDPEERARFRGLLSDLAGERIVILSTHIVSDVEASATSIALIADGRLVRHDPPEALLRAVAGRTWTCVVTSDELTSLRQHQRVSNAVRRSDGIHVRVVAESPPAAGAESVPPTLEEAYLFCIGSGSPSSARMGADAP